MVLLRRQLVLLRRRLVLLRRRLVLLLHTAASGAHGDCLTAVAVAGGGAAPNIAVARGVVELEEER